MCKVTQVLHITLTLKQTFQITIRKDNKLIFLKGMMYELQSDLALRDND